MPCHISLKPGFRNILLPVCSSEEELLAEKAWELFFATYHSKSFLSLTKYKTHDYLADFIAALHVLFALREVMMRRVMLFILGKRTTMSAHHGPSQQHDESVLTMENMIM